MFVLHLGEEMQEQRGHIVSSMSSSLYLTQTTTTVADPP